MSLIDKLKKQSTLQSTQIAKDSSLLNYKDELVNVGIPVVDIALSGSISGGLGTGLTVIAGPKAHFKSNLSLQMVRAYLNKYPDACCIFFDSEFGTSLDMMESAGIDTSRVLHTPVKDIEELKFETVRQLEGIADGEKVIMLIDSIGNIPSKKELEDAENQKSVADMSRAKALKSYFRIITPFLTIKKVPMVCIGHTYDTQELYSKQVLSGGTGIQYSANTIIFLSKSQEKDGKDLLGYTFKMIAEKSRFIREKSVIPLTVMFNGGIKKYSGIFDIAKDLNWITSPSMGWYEVVNPETGEVLKSKCRLKDIIDDGELWEKLFELGLAKSIEKRYKINLSDNEVTQEIVDETVED